jgi:ABC-2 type transport system permease protein
VRPYWELAVRGYRRKAVYLGATLAGVFTNSIFGLMRGYVLLALLAGRGTVGGYDAADALTYTWMTQALLATIELWGWNDVARRVASGDVAIDLGRPIDFQGQWLAEDAGRGAYQLVFRGMPPMVLGLVLFHLRLPTAPLTWLAFAASLGLAELVSFGFRFLVNLSAFWVIDYRGIVNMVTLAGTFLSGLAIPLSFLPGWARPVVYALPYASMLQVPIDVFLGKHRGVDLAAALAVQAAWAFSLLALGRLAMAAGVRRLVVQGG